MHLRTREHRAKATASVLNIASYALVIPKPRQHFGAVLGHCSSAAADSQIKRGRKWKV